jgi:hypothetical protein
MKDSLAPFKGVNAIPCPLGMDIEFLRSWARYVFLFNTVSNVTAFTPAALPAFYATTP